MLTFVRNPKRAVSCCHTGPPTGDQTDAELLGEMLGRMTIGRENLTAKRRAMLEQHERERLLSKAGKPSLFYI
jgi:hypothetical protein